MGRRKEIGVTRIGSDPKGDRRVLAEAKNRVLNELRTLGYIQSFDYTERSPNTEVVPGLMRKDFRAFMNDVLDIRFKWTRSKAMYKDIAEQRNKWK